MSRGQSPRALLTVVFGAAAVVAVSWATGAFLGFGGFAFAWVVHFAMMAGMSASMSALRPSPSGGWYQVRAWEPGLYRRLGVWPFMLLLRRIGWERANRKDRSYDGTRASLDAFELGTRRAELSHLILAVIGTALVLAAVVARAWTAVAWLSILNIVLHVYPVMLQRALRARLDRLQRALRRTPAPLPR
ncbi:hypothetical protein QEZ54_06925 [Catellatospora sp. KI3]|uniref:glycosyl-4,4'-diaponeurosporenoate acyltransferase CrtO family protein n=1 Tax=Catellatospora sp. KI3 TaxID=3041620 RepID=UPI002482590C|nr:hypothetical protein [Catellatospora sp. KI3]MDI1460692.1 hypothetical protein [Catellatospora sp. KI3]